MLRPIHRERDRRGRYYGALIVTLLFCLWSRPSFAHVLMDTPKANTTLAVGSTVVMTWEDLILHIGIGYDLDLISALDEVTPIVSGLSTSTHTYSWVVPNISCIGCYLRVTQVNRDHNYEDDVPVNIGTAPAGGAAGSGSAGSGGASSGAHGTGTSSAGAAGAAFKPPASGAGGTAGATPASAGAGGDGASTTTDEGAAGDAAAKSTGGTAGATSKHPSQSTSASGGAESETEDTHAEAGAIDDVPSTSTMDGSASAPSSGGCNMGAPLRRSSSGAILGVVALTLATRKRRVTRRAR